MAASILLATPWFGGDALARVSSHVRSSFFTDRARIATADAVMFHIPDWRHRAHDDLPKYPGQLWVAWSMESKVNYPRLADAAFMRHFDLVMSYERTADIFMPYGPHLSEWEAARTAVIAEREPVPAVMFQSARHDACGRLAFAAELMRHLRVDSYGAVLRNRTLAHDAGGATKRATIARYRFCLALENSIAPDYVTEKIYDPLLAGSIPVYRGAPNVADFVPEHSYIDAGAFSTPKKLAAYIYHLVENPEEAASYRRWRSRPLDEKVARIAAVASLDCWERLLARIAQMRQERGPIGVRPSYPLGLRRALAARWSRRGAAIYHRLRG